MGQASPDGAAHVSRIGSGMRTSTLGPVTQASRYTPRLRPAMDTLAVLIGLPVLWLLWLATAQTVMVEVDGIGQVVRTHRVSVDPLLLDLGLVLHPADRVEQGRAGQGRGGWVRITRAAPVQIVADGKTLLSASWGSTPRAILQDTGIRFDEYDTVSIAGVIYRLDDPLPLRMGANSGEAAGAMRHAPRYAWQQHAGETTQIRVIRAVPIVVDDGSLPFTIRTTAQTVGEALR